MAKVAMATALPGVTMDADGVTIPWNALLNLTQNELVAADDINPFMRALIEAVYSRIQALPVADRPTRMALVQGTQTAVTNLRNALNSPYTINFIITGTDFEVVSEP